MSSSMITIKECFVAIKLLSDPISLHLRFKYFPRGHVFTESHSKSMYATHSDIAKPGPTTVYGLPSNFKALPSTAKLESHDKHIR